MKKFLLMAAVAATLMMADSQLASARRGGCGGGRGGQGGGCGSSCGGCGMSYGGCGMGSGGCGMGGCGMGHGGGMTMGGCATCGGGGGYAMSGGMCANGVCSINGAVLAQATGNEATMVVNLPEDATLTIDGEETTSTSANRVFLSPSLEAGKEYEYTLKAKVIRDGKSQITTTKVTVRAGEVTPVELKIPAAGVAAQ